MVSYASLAELKDRLCISDSDRDFALERCLEGASRWIEKQTARRFYTVSETRYYTAPRYSSWVAPSDISERPGGGAQGFPIDDLVVPIVDDDPVYPTLQTDEDGDRVYEVTWTYGTDFWLEPFNAAADGLPYRRIERNGSTGRYFFPRLRGAISLTGSFGYASSTPAEIREVTLDAAEVLAQPVLDMGLAGVQQYQIGGEIGVELRVTLRPDELGPTAQMIIQNFKNPVFG